MNVRPSYRYDIFTASGSFESACRGVLSQAAALPGQLVRLVFFGQVGSRDSYLHQCGVIASLVDEIFGDRSPVCSYVPQPVMGGVVALECHSADDGAQVSYKKLSGAGYVTVECGSFKEVVAGGLRGDIGTALSVQCAALFAVARDILAAEGMEVDDIVRQWNYIEDITGFVGEFQNYQVFNDARTRFYSLGRWSGGYPAATGIGAGPCGVVVDFNSMRGGDVEIVALDNPLQTPAHGYSQEVLVGAEDDFFAQRTTPKFERGKAVLSAGSMMCYVSGTASIRGEESVAVGDVLAQTATTMENIDCLTSSDNLKRYGAVRPVGRGRYDMLRVYVKRADDMESVRDYMTARYPDTHMVFLHTDVCRDELLVEIEGIVSYAGA
ncbi:MAG: PTS cellobiose transporter subunit IIC [Rikenellaceae bacterium]|nr:PTS cellobiose transporter subunit IIC [Rikenellaceae bacterium]